MGVLQSCRTGCTWTGTTVSVVQQDGNLFILGVDTTLTYRFKWFQCDFPCVPCPDPQQFTMWYRKWNKATASWGSYQKVKPNTAAGTCGAVNVVRCTGTTSFNMNSSTNYFRELFWCERGIYQILMDSACTTGGLSAKAKARRKRVIVV